MARISGLMGLHKSPYDREIARLAVPALGALIAEPLYTLADTAVVGHLGTPHLGGLAVASQVLLGALSLFIFLAYGTTAAVGRLIGADDHRRAAHEVIYQLMFFLALVLDAVAIAGQAMIGRLLGAGELNQARAAGRRMIEWGLASGLAATAVLLVTRPWLPLVFSSDEAVLSLVGFLMLHLAFLQPVNGVVFALDGVLIGAGDMRFLAVAMAGAAAVFIPLALWVMAAGAGIGWLWGAIWALMAARLITLLWRFASARWLVPGAVR